MGEVVYLNRPKRFTLAEAQEMLPDIVWITESAVQKAQPLIERLQGENLPHARREKIGDRLQECVDDWISEISRRGAMVKGLWLVDFDAGDGYFCWKHGEGDIEFFHGHEDGFHGRSPLKES